MARLVRIYCQCGKVFIMVHAGWSFSLDSPSTNCEVNDRPGYTNRHEFPQWHTVYDNWERDDTSKPQEGTPDAQNPH